MRVLVTGGAGYLGTVLCEFLASRGDVVRVLDSREFRHQERMSREIELVTGDVRDILDVKKAVRDADVVIHLAAVVGQPACDQMPDRAKSTNIEGVRNVVRSLHREASLIFLSTSSVYGAQSGEFCDEYSIPSPESLYARTKLEAEFIALERDNSLVVRPATLFGISPHMRHDLLPHQLVQEGLGKGIVRVFEPQSVRSFLHVRDLCDGLACLASTRRTTGGRVVNASSSLNDMSKWTLAEAVAKVTGARPTLGNEYVDPDRRSYRVASRYSGFEDVSARTLLDELPLLVRYYRSPSPRLHWGSDGVSD